MMPETTDGSLLNGAVRYAQPRTGFRSGIEPVLLAAAVPARSGQSVLEAGSGAGAALLCLARRVPEIAGVGVERDPALVTIAAGNAAANGWPGVRFLAADIADRLDIGLFDHACANPPYHADGGTASPDPGREAARRAGPALFAAWAVAMGRRLRHGGTLTWIASAGALPACMTAFAAAGCPPTALLPLWPREGQPAKLVLLRGVKGSRARLRLLPGLVLHDAAGGFTPSAQAILRDGQKLPL